jgi:hypothetical protein
MNDMKNLSWHEQPAVPKKRVGLTMLTTAVMLVSVLMLNSCRKSTDVPFTDAARLTDSTAAPASSLTARGISYYLSPTGNDNNAGTLSSPWFSLEKAWSAVTPGDVIYMRGGTYAYSTQQDLLGKNGTATDLIEILNYPGENPVITGASNYAFQIGLNTDLIYFEGSYVHFKGLEIANFKQKPDQSPWFAFRAGFMQNCVVENINYHDNGAAFTIRGDGTGNLVLNSDFYRNQDPYSDTPFDGADGLAFTFNNNSNAVNTIRGCRFWWNADDGCDLWQNEGYVLIENSWSFYNGYIPGTFTTAGNGSGFKLGIMATSTTTVKRLIRNNVAFHNRSWGIVENNALTNMNIYNNSSINNGTWNYWFGSWGASPKTFRNNITMGGSTMWDVFGLDLGSSAIHSNNSWDGTVSATASDFSSMDSSQLTRARQADGSLPVITFLQLATGSDLINAGMNVGLPYSGSLPDLGAFESGLVTTAPTNMTPTANAGADKSITLPTNTVTLTGSGTDPDGTISSYQWTQQSGPSTATMTAATTTTMNVSALVAGTYVFRLKVTDNGGLSGTDDVTVTVTGTISTNTPPTANAGADKTITLPTNTVSLTGSGTDAGGSISSYAWTQQSGPSTATVSGAASTVLTASGLVAGTYVFRLKVTDNGGLTATDDVSVIVQNAATPTGSSAYGGTPRAIPGTIQAEDFDNGGSSVAYNDLSAGNLGQEYRVNESVDISYSNKEGSNFIGWTQAGEWAKYSVNIASTRAYTLKMRFASAGGGKTVRIEIDGATVATVTLPNTGSTDSWATVSVTGINLTAGLRTLRIYNVSGGQSINYIKFQ